MVRLYQTTKFQTSKKSKTFADDSINVVHKLKFVFEMVKSIVGKLLLPAFSYATVFSECFFLVSMIVGIMW